MTGTESIRKSNRLSKNENVQSRITEFVNVRKRAVSIDQLKKSTTEDVAETTPASQISTPVKIKRKIQKLKVDESVVSKAKSDNEPSLTNGMLTPSPSVESVSEEIKSTEEKPAKVPAYKRFAHLIEVNVRNQKPKLEAEEVKTLSLDKEVKTVCDAKVEPVMDCQSKFKAVPWLPLNEKWSIYEKIIFNVDNLCVLAAGRSQPCVFHKIQKTLENVLGRQVPIDQMERLKTLWPEAYEYRENKIVMQGKRVESVALSIPGIADTENSAGLLNERKEEVRGRVQKYLLEAHQKEFFPSEPLGSVPKQWHSKFDQNSVAEISKTPLILCETVPVRPDTPKLINEIIINQTPSKRTETEISSVIKDQPVEERKLSLLERIRAKEAKLQVQKCFGNSETARLEAILSQMDRFTQSVMFTFTSSKKTSLFLTDLTAKLMQSSTIPLNQAEVLERLKLLEKAAPDWIKIVDETCSELSSPKHVKILDKTRSLNYILDRLKKLKQS